MMSDQKNVIWIFGDQHRGQALGIPHHQHVLGITIEKAM